MATFHQKLDNVKESLASLFKSRRRRSLHVSDVGDDGSISTPQNVRRVMHITFDAGRRSFDGIPAHWRQYFEAAAASAAATAVDDHSPTVPEEMRGDDSGVSMATATTSSAAAPAPKELLSLTYDRDSGKFVDLPSHWRDRLERNNLLAPEFQRNPDLLVGVFALMDEELRAMSREGFELDEGMYSSSPTGSTNTATAAAASATCHYVYEIEADRSNTSSERDLQTPGDTIDEACCFNDAEVSFQDRQHRRHSLVRLRAVSAPGAVMQRVQHH